MNPYEVLNLPPSATREDVRTAYRKLARRWHPDRFMEGPERDWANEKMVEINAAYRAITDGTADIQDAAADARTLRRIEELTDGGQYSLARRMLMSIATRCAEWNYLFGALLLKLKDTSKAIIYLTVASHQQPENAKYARALDEARREELRERKPFSTLLERVRSR